MLFLSQKYKPVLSKKEPDFNSSIIPSIQGKGINELIERVKKLKVKENQKKRNVDNKISFD
jgi:hypothetical protein